MPLGRSHGYETLFFTIIWMYEIRLDQRTQDYRATMKNLPDSSRMNYRWRARRETAGTDRVKHAPRFQHKLPSRRGWTCAVTGVLEVVDPSVWWTAATAPRISTARSKQALAEEFHRPRDAPSMICKIDCNFLVVLVRLSSDRPVQRLAIMQAGLHVLSLECANQLDLASLRLRSISG